LSGGGSGWGRSGERSSEVSSGESAEGGMATAMGAGSSVAGEQWEEGMGAG